MPAPSSAVRFDGVLVETADGEVIDAHQADAALGEVFGARRVDEDEVFVESSLFQRRSELAVLKRMRSSGSMLMLLRVPCGRWTVRSRI